MTTPTATPQNPSADTTLRQAALDVVRDTCDFEGWQAAYKVLQDMNGLFGGRTDGWTAIYAKCQTVIKQAREAEAIQAQQAHTSPPQNFYIFGDADSALVNGIEEEYKTHRYVNLFQQATVTMQQPEIKGPLYDISGNNNVNLGGANYE